MIQLQITRQKKLFPVIILSVFLVLLLCGLVFSQDNKNFQIKKQPEIQQVKPKKPVKIKLRRSAEDRYTWEITGDDADEIVRADLDPEFTQSLNFLDEVDRVHHDAVADNA